MIIRIPPRDPTPSLLEQTRRVHTKPRLQAAECARLEEVCCGGMDVSISVNVNVKGAECQYQGE